MNTKIIKIDPESFRDEELFYAAEAIREGKLVAFPTETVYGLGANALNGEACDRIFEAKGRPHDNPLIVHIAKPEDAFLYAECPEPELFQSVVSHFMPGPITVILPKKSVIPDSVTVGLQTVALRCPSHPVAHRLIELAGVPIAAPSANLSGKPSPTTARHVIEDMSGRIDCILDGKDAEVGVESTVISIHNGSVRLLRPGYVTAEMLKSAVGNVEVDPAVLSQLKEGVKPESPGMKYRHYAPSAPVSMVCGDEEKVIAFFRERLRDGDGILCFDEDLPLFKEEPHSQLLRSFGSRFDLSSQAHRLFDALRYFDQTSVRHIYARETQKNDLGLAVTNRLLRACAFERIDL